MRPPHRLCVLLVVAALAATACSGDDAADTPTAATAPAEPPAATAPATTPAPATDPGTAPATAPPTTPPATAVATTDARAPAEWTVQPGWEQVAVLDATPGERLELVDDGGRVVTTGDVDDLGSLLLRDVAAGTYSIRSADATADPFKVADLEDLPPPAVYAEQRLPAGGYGYLETRDGTTLSVNVVLPGPADGGPYPTVVEYSGYAPSDPEASGLPQLFTALGYAYVGVNMRGSGCSGGSYRFFEDAQQLDGYDAIETVAAQPWVLDNRVGMVGVSYPGITQLFVASTRPPSLAAITPLSVIDDSYQGVLYPGGILNTGFAVEWTQDRMDETAPEGQAWTVDRIAAGDTTCAANQRLRLQNPDLVAEIRANPFWTEELGAPLAPRTFVERIEVPVLVAGAWQDEQTGGRFATMLDRFTGTDHVYATLTNGLHTDSIGPGAFARLVEFLDLYVARRVPSLEPARGIAAVLADGLYGTDQITLAPDRFGGLTYDEARAAFEAEPHIQVLFESGAAEGAAAGTPVARWTAGFDAWPVPGARARNFYLGADGALGDARDPAEGAQSYRADPDALPATFFDAAGGSVWAHDVEWQWQQPPAGTAASFTTAPLEQDMVVVGSGSAALFVRTDAPDTDVEVTVSEIRPDGQELYVQSGWLRASKRTLDEAASTELRPVYTYAQADAAPLPAGEWTPLRVELLPFAHAFRAGSQLRVTVDAPGNNRAQWVFETIADGETVEIGYGGNRPSSLVLPVVAGVEVPAALPACTLRGQPCRAAPG